MLTQAERARVTAIRSMVQKGHKPSVEDHQFVLDMVAREKVVVPKRIVEHASAAGFSVKGVLTEKVVDEMRA